MTPAEHGQRWTSIFAAGERWRDVAVSGLARSAWLEDLRPTRSPSKASASVSEAPSEAMPGDPGIASTKWSLWAVPPDSVRIEMPYGNEMLVAVRRGGHWLTWARSEGFRTVPVARRRYTGFAVADPLIYAQQLLRESEVIQLAPEHRSKPGQRRFMVKAPPPTSGHGFSSFGGWAVGADEYEVWYHERAAIALAVSARYGGTPTGGVRITTFDLDVHVPKALFALDADRG